MLTCTKTVYNIVLQKAMFFDSDILFYTIFLKKAHEYLISVLIRDRIVLEIILQYNFLY